MREPPLTDSELRWLRGMIDEYRADQGRDRFLGEVAHGTKVALAGLGALLVLALQIAALVVALRGGG